MDDDITSVLYLKIKELWLNAHDLVDRGRSITFASPSAITKYYNRFQEYIDKCKKITKYIISVREELANLDDILDRTGFKLKEEDDRPTKRDNDSPTRTTKDRQDSTSKQISRFNPLVGD